MKAAIWARVPTDRQETENQVRQLREHGARRGFEGLDDLYVLTVSGWRGKQRNDLERIIRDGSAAASRSCSSGRLIG